MPLAKINYFLEKHEAHQFFFTTAWIERFAQKYQVCIDFAFRDLLDKPDPDLPLEDKPDQAADSTGAADAGMVVAVETWQQLLALEMDLARYLRGIAEPGDSTSQNG